MSFRARGESQPVAWRPLVEAFADGRPVLLFAGAFYDHATHLADAELFDEPAVARRLDGFACVRVDVDASPALAARLAPGLPRIVIVAPDGKLLADRLRPTAADLSTLLERGPAQTPPAPPTTPPSSLADWEPLCDFRLGGFGRPPKLPHAPALTLLLDHAELPWARPFVERTLNAIVQGGLHDHLGGGFHRASADDAWVVPLFGKRAEDQAALVPLLRRAGERFSQRRFTDAAERAHDFVVERLAAPDGAGGYYNAEDCDAGPWDDASYHTFSADEARAILDDDEWQVAQPWFDLYGRGELHSDPTRNVLFVASSVERLAGELRRPPAELPPLIERARKKLAAAQRERPRPDLDRSIYAATSAQLALLDLPRAPATLERLTALDAGVSERGWLADPSAVGLLAHALDKGDLADAAVARLEAFRDGDLYYDSTPSSLPGFLGERRLPFLDGAGASGAALTVRLLQLRGHTDRAAAFLAALHPRASAAGPSGAGLLALSP
jgi:uncharacterized protein YyaL (SSP411 family)